MPDNHATGLPVLTPDAGFTEIADRVWVARTSWYDVNVTAIQGEHGVLVIDTHASEPAFAASLAALRRVTSAPVLGVVLTHAHVDHALGTAVLRDADPDLPVIATEPAAAALTSFALPASDEAYGAEKAAESAAARVIVPDTTFVSAWAVDLGDRMVELVHPGRGHTDGDLVARLFDPSCDADVVVAGDVVEESGAPAYGVDSFPLEWPGALDLVTGMLTPATLVVPGHGTVVGPEFVHLQRGDLGAVAETIFDLASRGVPLEEAVAEISGPFPAATLAAAVRAAYPQVPRTARRLPLV